MQKLATYWLMLIFILCPASAYGNLNKYIKPKTVHLTYAEHAEMQPFINFIKQVYLDIGIQTIFTNVPLNRAFNLIEEGLVDGDVIRIDDSIRQHKNLLVVQPPIATGELVLICQKTKVCNRNLLHNRNINILTNVNNVTILNLTDNVEANILFESSANNTIDMMTKKRVNYAIYAVVSKQYKADLSDKFQVVSLMPFTLNHTLHVRHRALLPELTIAITKNLHAHQR